MSPQVETTPAGIVPLENKRLKGVCKVNFVARGVSEGLGELWLLWVQREEFLVPLCFVCAVVAAMGCRAQPRQAGRKQTNKAFFPAICSYLQQFAATRSLC